MKANKKEIILTAASKIFSEKGFHLATVEEIAKEASVGKGTIYQYFPSKAAIFQELHYWYMERYMHRLNNILDENDTFRHNMARIIENHIDNFVEVLDLVIKVNQEMQHPTEFADNGLKESALELLHDIEKRLVHLLELAIERGEIRPISPHLVTHLIEGTLFGVIHAMLSDIDEQDKQQLKDELLDLIMRGISA